MKNLGGVVIPLTGERGEVGGGRAGGREKEESSMKVTSFVPLIHLPQKCHPYQQSILFLCLKESNLG